MTPRAPGCLLRGLSSFVGDMYMTLIYTCELNGMEAFDYLNALQLNAASIARYPADWMPWNDKDSLSTIPVCATVPERHGPQT